MIRLITGLPGAGKTLRGVQVIRKFLAEGRAVYVDGIDGLQPFGWEPCNARDWQNLPDGSVIVVDEAQKIWPTRRSGDTPPDIRALSEHRHHGLDFVLLTQHPTMLDAYVRKLVGQHEHVLRQFGMEASRIVTWTECQDDPQSLATRQRGTDALWKYPSECFPLYKSATLHTVKRRIPMRLLMIPFLLVLAGFLGWWGWSAITSIAETDAGALDPSAGKVDAGAPGYLDGMPGVSGERVKYATPEDYVRAFIPRVAVQPWSAPAFDQREVRAEPELYCVHSEAKACQCYTEQITRVSVPQSECMRVVRSGAYNPFRAPFTRAGGNVVTGRPDLPIAGAAAERHYEELPVPRSAGHVLREPINAGSVWPVRR